MVIAAFVLQLFVFVLVALRWTPSQSSGEIIMLEGVPAAKQERSDLVDTDVNDALQTRYHSWGPEGIDLRQILRYINETYYDNVTWTRPIRSYQPFPLYIVLHNDTPTIWVPRNILRRIFRGAAKRLKIMLPYFQQALQIQLGRNRKRYSSLVSVLARVGSLPLLFDLSDFRECQDPTSNASDIRYRLAGSVPLFTLCRSPRCRYAFPIPTYSSYEYMKIGYINGTNRWQEKMDEWAEVYPWSNKTSQVFWRGGCKGPRKDFVIRAQTDRRFLNVRSVGNRCGTGPNIPRLGQPTPPEYSMRYKAVFDIDGNAWSERLPRLLCYNSVVVVLSIEDDFEEYFMLDLTPGVHFIPASMENFTEVARIINRKENEGMLQNVVKNANAWCRERLTEERLNLDFLSVLNGYVEMLNVRDPYWVEEWDRVATSYVGPEVFKNGHGGFSDQVDLEASEGIDDLPQTLKMHPAS